MNELSPYEDTITTLRESLEGVEYRRPVPTGPRRRKAIRVAVVVGALAILVGVVMTPGREAPAWAAVGREANAEEVEQASEVCMSDLFISEFISEMPPLRVGEVRGQSGYFAFADDDYLVTCFVEGLGGDPTVIGGSHGERNLNPPRGGEGDLLPVLFALSGDSFSPTPLEDGDHVPVVDGTEAIEQAKWIMVMGYVSDNVDRLIVRSDRHGEFTALVFDGEFVAWWPGGNATVVALDAAGKELDDFPAS